MRKRTLAAAATAALILAAGCGLGGGSDTTVTEDNTATTTQSTAPAKAAAKPAKIGSSLTVSVDGSAVSWKLEKVEAKSTDKFGQRPTGGGKWVLVKVTATAKDGRDAQVWGGQLSIVSATGTVHEPDPSGLFDDRETFTGSNLSAGQSAGGWTVFSIPAKDLPGATLQLKQLSFLDENGVATWNLGLK